ncbi:MAG: hypothetical protein AB7G93_17255 [Bdellovibrionales bacterium]
MRSFCTITAILFCCVPMFGHALQRTVETFDYSAFDHIPPEALVPQHLYYAEEILPFRDWSLQRFEEKLHLGLVPEYQEPYVIVGPADPSAQDLSEALHSQGLSVEAVSDTSDLKTVVIMLKNRADRANVLTFLESLYSSQLQITRSEGVVIEATRINSEPKRVLEKLRMYVVKTKTVINRPVASIPIDGRIKSIDFIRRLDPTIQHREIHPEETLPHVMSTGRKVRNFNQCNTNENYIFRAQRHRDLRHLQLRNWCQEGTCVESCHIFAKEWRQIMNNKHFQRRFGRKDKGLALQSEIRTFHDERQIPNVPLVGILTKIPTPAHAVIRWEIFYVNQVFEYGKMLIVLQAHPRDPNKTVMTSFIAMGVREGVWSSNPLMPPLLRGELDGKWLGEWVHSYIGEWFPVNTADGITAGIPKWTQGLAKRIAELLEE